MITVSVVVADLQEGMIMMLYEFVRTSISKPSLEIHEGGPESYLASQRCNKNDTSILQGTILNLQPFC